MYSMPVVDDDSEADFSPKSMYENVRDGEYMPDRLRVRPGVYTGEGPFASRAPADEDRLEELFGGGGGLRYDGDQSRFMRSVERSYRSLEPFREMNHSLTELYGGSSYGEDENHPNRYLNLIQQAVEAAQINLVSDKPRALVSTEFPQYKAFSKHFQRALNALVKEIHLPETLEQWIMDAYFCVGIIKTHMANAGMVQVETDLWMDPGRPFASNIALDDFVYDMKANKWSEVRYAGDMYRLSWEEAIDIFGEDAMSDHQPSTLTQNDERDRVEGMSRSQENDQDDLEDMIDLIDLWVPRHGVVYTYVIQDRTKMSLAGPGPIAVEEWTGDELGPYHLLGFHDVPENIMPSSPAANLELLETLVNDLMRKESTQARAQKTVTTYTAGAAKDVQNVAITEDGGTVCVNDPNEIGQLTFGGVDAGTHGFMIGGIELFDRMAGNLSAQLGLGAQAGTLGQDRLIHGAASRKVDKMGKRVIEKTSRLFRCLGMMLWQDSVKEIVMEIPIPGTSITVSEVWKPGDREGNFIDFNFDVDIYSMRYEGPEEKIQKLTTVVQQVIMPLAPYLQQQGGMVDMFALVETFSELMNLPELRNVVKFMGGSGDDMELQPLTKVPSSPPNGTRRYVRENVSAGQNSPMAQSSQMMNAAATAGPQTPGGMT